MQLQRAFFPCPKTPSFCFCGSDIQLQQPQHLKPSMVLECWNILLLPATASVSIYLPLLWKSKLAKKQCNTYSTSKLCKCPWWIYGVAYSTGKYMCFTTPENIGNASPGSDILTFIPCTSFGIGSEIREERRAVFFFFFFFFFLLQCSKHIYTQPIQ